MIGIKSGLSVFDMGYASVVNLTHCAWICSVYRFVLHIIKVRRVFMDNLPGEIIVCHSLGPDINLPQYLAVRVWQVKMRHELVYEVCWRIAE